MAVAAVARTPTAQDRAAATLRAAILDGELRPGQRVNQEAWAERARREPDPGAGGAARARRRRAGDLPAAARLRGHRARPRRARGGLSPQELLETDACCRGVAHATPADLRALEAARRTRARAAAAAGDVAGQLAANRRFHDRLHALAESRPAAAPDRPPLGLDRGLPRALLRLPGEAAEADRAHRAIIAAVAGRDVDAVVRLQDAHRERALARLRGTLWGEAHGLPPQVPRMG